MIRFKSSVSLAMHRPAIVHMLVTLSLLSDLDQRDYTVTSGHDGNHSIDPMSRHYMDEAIDVRTNDIKGGAAVRSAFCSRFEVALGPLFRVLFENAGGVNEHAHAQVRKGVRYP